MTNSGYHSNENLGFMSLWYEYIRICIYIYIICTYYICTYYMYIYIYVSMYNYSLWGFEANYT